MSEQQINNVTHVKEIHDVNSGLPNSILNRHLAKGWILLETFKTTDAKGSQTLTYVIGWPKPGMPAAI